MKLSCLPVCFYGAIVREKSMTWEDWLDIAVDYGLEGTEIYGAHFDDSDATDLMKLSDMIHKKGLQVTMFTTENDFSRPDKKEQAIVQVQKAVDAALLFKADIVRVTASSPYGPFKADRKWIDEADRDEVVQSCADGLKACLDYAAEKQVTLALEDHPLIGWNIDEFMKILDLVGDERLKVNLDTSNIDPTTIVDLARRVADRVVHLHVKDIKEGNNRIVFGTGEVDFVGIFKELKNVGYDGWLSLETMSGGKEELKIAIEHITNAWNKA
ncbi:MAG: sugar phosphate isomerase/epimerase [Deltaproteobacteria bacterium]|jgi:sugar phosphate isomerase/epimerase|nr:sugar phosphate isomerase/epimerase [Deltaproteobacteria bacterium]MBT4642067.1 sugar phosphate isomerase/epimerase [Deltaproteobacteria bacterium]MBT6498431.1 sugar phosphate isomerase/epimerase [Deltaproteobacteria bacterium]MBT6614535.1 sugar phosphate isomerase/epimerase [Deltaproteobacteria bacterium]MBT7152971.1 sugar phosphate isomerase/epimerase [Deltaproteobacteria bacterium]